MQPIAPDKEQAIKAAAFDHLMGHLQQRTNVQNIDLMILADFCRNCLSKWVAKAAEKEEVELSYENAREIVYGMPYQDWKALYQKPATAAQLASLKDK